MNMNRSKLLRAFLFLTIISSYSALSQAAFAQPVKEKVFYGCYPSVQECIYGCETQIVDWIIDDPQCAYEPEFSRVGCYCEEYDFE